MSAPMDSHLLCPTTRVGTSSFLYLSDPPPVASDEGQSQQIPRKGKRVGNGVEFSFGVRGKKIC